MICAERLIIMLHPNIDHTSSGLSLSSSLSTGQDDPHDSFFDDMPAGKFKLGLRGPPIDIHLTMKSIENIELFLANITAVSVLRI